MRLGGNLLLVDPGFRNIRIGVLFFNKIGTPDLVYTKCFKSAGMNCGTVSSIDDLAEAAHLAIETTRKESGVQSFSETWIGHSGAHIRGDNVTKEDTLRHNTPVNQRIERQLRRKAEQHIPGDSQLIHSFKQFTLLDGVRVSDVNKQTGAKLASRYHIVFSLKDVLNNLRTAFKAAGITPSRFLFNGYTASIAVGHQEEFKLGCLVIHLGHSTVDYSVYQDGKPFLSGSVNNGWASIIRDVAMHLEISEADAEKAVCEYGVAYDIDTRHNTPLNMTSLFGEAVQKTRQDLAEAIHERIDELFTLVCDRLRNTICRGHIPGGVYLTGGGALTSGISYPAMEVFGVHSRVGYPVLPWIAKDYDPSWATIIGMAKEASEKIFPVIIPQKTASRIHYYSVNYLKRMFPRQRDKIASETESDR